MAWRRFMRSPAGVLAVLISCGWMTACHTYTPVETPAPGSTVRVHIPVRSALDRPNAPTRTQSVEGQVVEAGDTIVLATRTRQEYGAFREIIQYDTLRLAPEQHVGVEVREFSRGRSVALGIGITAIVAGAALAALGGVFGSGGEGLPDDGGPAPSVVVTPSVVSSLLGLLLGN